MHSHIYTAYVVRANFLEGSTHASLCLSATAVAAAAGLPWKLGPDL